MDSIRKPELTLSITNTVGLVGVIFYGMKTSAAIQQDITDLKKALELNINRVGDTTVLNAAIKDTQEMVRQVDLNVKKSNEKMGKMGRDLITALDDIEQLQTTVQHLYKQLKAADIKIEPPPRQEEDIFGRSRRQPPRVQQQRQPPRARHSYDEEIGNSEEDIDAAIAEVRGRRSEY